jgi:hypothetical protein
MKKLNLLIVLSLTLLLSCSKDDIEPVPIIQNGENSLNDNAFIVDTIAIAGASDDNVIIFKNGTVLRPVVGDILLGAPCVNAPYGFLRKVLSVNDNNSQIICITEQSALNEAFKELHIDTTFDEPFDIAKDGRMTNVNLERNVTFNFVSNTTYFKNLKIEGPAKCSLSPTTFKYDKVSGSTLPTYVLLKVEMNTDGSALDISSSGEIVNIDSSVLATWPLPDTWLTIPIPTAVGPIPFPIRITQKITLKTGPISVNGKFKWSLAPRINATLGVVYENGEWKNLSTSSINATSNPLTIENFLTANSFVTDFTIVNPEYSFSPYGNEDVAKFYCNAPIVINFNQQLVVPNYSLKIKFGVNVGISTKFWDNRTKKVELTQPIISKTIAEGNWINTDCQNSTLAITATVNGNNVTATATGGNAPYEFSWSNGSSGSVVTGLNSGTYSVTVSDGLKCTKSVSVTIGIIDSCSTSTLAVTTSATANSATATATGGQPPYTYLWSNGSTSATANNLPNGNNNVKVTDGAGCTRTVSVNIGVVDNLTGTSWTLESYDGGKKPGECSYYIDPDFCGKLFGAKLSFTETTFTLTVNGSNQELSTGEVEDISGTITGTRNGLQLSASNDNGSYTGSILILSAIRIELDRMVFIKE